mmetsp:Transcript_27262/g.38342  ORF Transcript_27262/g.38342 Transcript_27262/m.38342 type:complete len:521 (-) Transcript_27262:21-1583(-)
MSKSKSPSLRRIQADIRELALDPSDQYYAAPLESDMFEWHFTIRGAPGTDFEGGIYHGRILLPPEYPFKPPHILFLTPSGRFETNTKICLSFSAYHPELWQPAWGIRLILEALISFLPTPADGAIGALDWKPSERKRLAKQSVDFCCAKCCGVGGKVIDTLPKLKPKSSSSDDDDEKNKKPTSRFQKEIEQLQLLQMQNEQPKIKTNEKEEDDSKKDETKTADDTTTATANAAMEESKEKDSEKKNDGKVEKEEETEEEDSKPAATSLPASASTATAASSSEEGIKVAAVATSASTTTPNNAPELREDHEDVVVQQQEDQEPEHLEQQQQQQQHFRNEAHAAAQSGNVIALRQIARSSPYLLYEQDENGWTPLHEACRSGHREIVQFIYMFQKDEIHVVTNGQQTPLDLALEYHGPQHSVTKYLIALGAKTYNDTTTTTTTEEEQNQQEEIPQHAVTQRIGRNTEQQQLHLDEDVFGWVTDTTLQFMFGILLVICYLFAKKGYDLYEELKDLQEQLESMD